EPKDLCRVGTIAQIKQVLNLPGDSIRVLVEGVQRAVLSSITENEPCMIGMVRPVREEPVRDSAEMKALVRTAHEFIEEKKNYYDIVIVDSTDPGGPGEPLFNGEFYTGIKAALREGGVVTSQGESAFLLPDIVARLNRITGKVFKYSGYATLHVPTYPTGVIGACVASDFAEVTTPAREVEPELQKVLRYYNSEIHTACFVQPNFVRALFK
ncbi:MAG: LON peptidase substrate-binding domain-containing protein, partial [Lentisphaeria bacterium]|nr:LON peptidase substrate-binding domain-containing protein [Lentisphaeria bacterium]